MALLGLQNQIFCGIKYRSAPLSAAHLHSPKKVSGHFADFLYKTAFLKSNFEDDPVRVQRRNVSHFKGLE